MPVWKDIQYHQSRGEVRLEVFKPAFKPSTLASTCTHAHIHTKSLHSYLQRNLYWPLGLLEKEIWYSTQYCLSSTGPHTQDPDPDLSSLNNHSIQTGSWFGGCSWGPHGVNTFIIASRSYKRQKWESLDCRMYRTCKIITSERKGETPPCIGHSRFTIE